MHKQEIVMQRAMLLPRPAGSATDVLTQRLGNVKWNFTLEDSVDDDDTPFPYIGLPVRFKAGHSGKLEQPV
jgi:hypothetical protein